MDFKLDSSPFHTLCLSGEIIPSVNANGNQVTLPGSVNGRQDQCPKAVHHDVQQFSRTVRDALIESEKKMHERDFLREKLQIVSKFKALQRHCTSYPDVTCLYGMCVNTPTDSEKSLAVAMNQNQAIVVQIPGHIICAFSRISV